MKRLALIVVLVALVAGGCGEKKKSGGDAASSTDETTTTVAGQIGGGGGTEGGGTGTTVTPGGSTNTTAKGGTTQTTAAGGVTTTSPTSDPSVTMKLDRACVRKGALGDSQGLTATTSPGDIVAWSTEYSDHSNEMSNPSYKTGSGYGKAGSDGRFHSEWKVPDNAPLGEAILHTIAKGKLQPYLRFTVVDTDGKCP